jgi:1-acyl-sn-glycerol-3-phosphate acyltransferase
MIEIARLLLHILIIRPTFYVLFGINVIGRENLTGLESFILYANHNSHLDTFLLFQTLPYRKINKTHPLAAYDYFKKPVWLYKTVDFLFQPIWLDRDADGSTVIREVQKRLDQKHSIIIFPEGTRGETADIQEFRHGIGLIAKKNSTIPILPVFLEGPERVFPKNGFFPIPFCNHITVSPPQIVCGNTKDITSDLHRYLIILSKEEQTIKQRKPVAQRKPIVIATIGIDGSGKSTLSRQICKYLHEECCFIGDNLELYKDGEPYNSQPLITNEIRMWVGRKAKKAKNLVRYKIPKLTELLLRDRLLSEVLRWYRPSVVVMDGSPILNMAAWAHLYHDEVFDESVCLKALDFLTGKELLPIDDKVLKQFPELQALRRLNLAHLHMPDIVFFLDIEPEVSIKRINLRGEGLQAHENIEKLTKLRTAYQFVCNVLSQSQPVCHLNAENSLEQLGQDAEKFIAEVRRRDDAED